MECPYLEMEGEVSLCNASMGCMKPGNLEMVRYCTKEEHYRCPILLAHALRRGSARRLSWAAVV